jgi:lipoprotein-anchoring transpeptidase ErfK/SrfK
LLVTQKRIVVSLSEQKLWAYDGEQVALQSLVTTGGPQLPTPAGTFQILSKQSPFTFHSPWPKGSPYWYPDSPTSYAMLFDEEGFFLHDAPWRHTFGPGSNLVPGQPGEETSGTHGCVNVPLDVQAQLYAWTDLGTPVIIQP